MDEDLLSEAHGIAGHILDVSEADDNDYVGIYIRHPDTNLKCYILNLKP
jgi:hypothetical protein